MILIKYKIISNLTYKLVIIKTKTKGLWANNIDVVKFDDMNNFEMWRWGVMDALTTWNLEDALCLKEKPKETSKKDWYKINQKVCSDISSCLTETSSIMWCIRLLQGRFKRSLKVSIWRRALRLDCFWRGGFTTSSWRKDSPLMITWITTRSFLQI